MAGRIHIDCFSSLDDLPKKLHGCEDSVFNAIKVAGRVSTFEMTQILWNTINCLKAKGRITELKAGYPWHKYQVNDLPSKGSEHE